MDEGGGFGVEKHQAHREVPVQVIEQREMTDAEVESLASLLFTWWRREFERERDERAQRTNGEKL